MKKLCVDLFHHKYEIIIGQKIIQDAKKYISEVYNGNRLFIITDSNVYDIYKEKIKNIFKDYDYYVYVFPAGEQNKTLDTISSIYKEMAKYNLNRKEMIVALGGGVVGDMAGFAAATYLRGIKFIQIPTTIISQVDSSVGGKVGVDLEEGKNLVGSFYQPSLVLIDVDFLNTLSDRYFFDGMAEVVKYGCIYDSEFFDFLNKIALSSNEENLRQQIMSNITEIVYKSCDIKRYVVEKDEKEENLRMILNFGHTIGHALEKHYNFEKYTHGEAIAIGMVEISKLGEKLNITEKGTKQKIEELLVRLNLPTKDNYPVEEIIQIIKLDKKADSKGISLVFVEKMGSVEILNIGTEELRKNIT